MASRKVTFKPYRREFRVALNTARQKWTVRQGFIVRVEQEGRVGYGEVAPIPEFGSETFEDARNFLERVSDCPGLEVPENLPCCAFALSSALLPASGPLEEYAVAALLPAGNEALQALVSKVRLGYRTFKWKLGVASPDKEQLILKKILQILPEGSRLRLDANGAWSEEIFSQWLEFLQSYRNQVEFLEQPMSVGCEHIMSHLAEGSGISIALDESLNGACGFRWLDEWQGPLVIKPLLMGDCRPLLRKLSPYAERIVLSSVFETGIGVLNALHFADALPGLRYAIGFDTQNFSDTLSMYETSNRLTPEDRVKILPHKLWKNLPL